MLPGNHEDVKTNAMVFKPFCCWSWVGRLEVLQEVDRHHCSTSCDIAHQYYYPGNNVACFVVIIVGMRFIEIYVDVLCGRVENNLFV